MTEFTWVDFIIVGFFFLSVGLGLARGLFKEAISIASVIFGLVIMVRYTAPLANWLNASNGAQDVILAISTFFDFNAATQVGQLTIAITLLLLFMGPYTLGEALNYYGVVEALIMPRIIPIIYRLLGAALGFVRGYVFSLIFIIFMELTPVATWDAWKGSVLVPQLQPNATALANKLETGSTMPVGPIPLQPPRG